MDVSRRPRDDRYYRNRNQTPRLRSRSQSPCRKHSQVDIAHPTPRRLAHTPVDGLLDNMRAGTWDSLKIPDAPSPARQETVNSNQAMNQYVPQYNGLSWGASSSSSFLHSGTIPHNQYVFSPSGHMPETPVDQMPYCSAYSRPVDPTQTNLDPYLPHPTKYLTSHNSNLTNLEAQRQGAFHQDLVGLGLYDEPFATLNSHFQAEKPRTSPLKLEETWVPAADHVPEIEDDYPGADCGLIDSTLDGLYYPELPLGYYQLPLEGKDFRDANFVDSCFEGEAFAPMEVDEGLSAFAVV